jgi:hypothetical protein
VKLVENGLTAFAIVNIVLSIHSYDLEFSLSIDKRLKENQARKETKHDQVFILLCIVQFLSVVIAFFQVIRGIVMHSFKKKRCLIPS